MFATVSRRHVAHLLSRNMGAQLQRPAREIEVKDMIDAAPAKAPANHHQGLR